MLNAKVLVGRFFDQPNLMMWVRVTPASVVNLNFNLPSWLGWMKSLAVMWNWILSLMTFLISLPSMFSRTIGLKNLGKLYNNLFGLEIIIVVDFLKWFGQYPKLIQVFAIPMMLTRQSSCFRTDLRWFQDNLSRPRVDKLLQLLIAILNFSFENRDQLEMGLLPILSRILMSTWRFRTLLKEEWSAFHKLLSKRHGKPLCLMVSIVGNFCLLT